MKQLKISVFYFWCILILGLVLRFWNINQSFWWDEIWSTLPYAKAHSLWGTISGLGYYFNNHVLYSLLCRISFNIFGETEFTARLPALLMGLVGIYTIYYVGTKLIDYRSGLLASLLLSVSAFHIDHSTEARGYSGLALFSLLSSFCYLKALKTNSRSTWILFCLYTVLGFYTHVFMLAVAVTEFLFSFLLTLLKRLRSHLCISRSAVFYSFVSIVITSLVVVVLYSPLLLKFYNNLGKVRLVSIDRLPFIKNLINSLLPDFPLAPIGLIYALLLLYGLVILIRKNILIALYIIILLVVPLSLYLATNPMFVFERYFIFTLPFFLLIISTGAISICNSILQNNSHRKIMLSLFIVILILCNIPSVLRTITSDRQNYREAIRYVEHEIQDNQNDTALIAIGHAGSHFQYYTTLPILVPQSLEQFNDVLRHNKIVWCLITAWLPSLRPPHEDPILYAESPEDLKIYDFVVNHFRLDKIFPAKFPTQIYKYAQ